MSTFNCPDESSMPSNRNYAVARQELIAFLRRQGFVPHPNEVFCPAEHCWVDVGALKGQDYWAFEYKSRNDSIKRGLEQCCCYAEAFNYVVLVADRQRTSSSPYFGRFKSHGFGVWSHTPTGFYPLLNPKRRSVVRKANLVVQRQFRRLLPRRNSFADSRLTDWFVSQQPCESPNETHDVGDREEAAFQGLRSSMRLSGSRLR